MAPRKCCCDVDCLILFDDFDRADSTSLGAAWEEVTGNAEIVSAELLVDAGVKVASVDGNTSHRGTLVFTWETAATGTAKLEITLNYGGAAPCAATVEITDTTLTLTVGAFTRTITSTDIGQNSRLVWARDPSDRYTVEVCLTNNLFYIQCYTEDAGDVKGAALWDHEFTLPTTGDGRMAIEAVTGDAIIDNVTFQRHYDDNTECPDYCCECTPPGTAQPNRRWPPWKTRIDFYSDDGAGLGCDVFNGGYLLFENAVAGGTEVGSFSWECIDGLMDGVDYGYGSGQPNHFWACSYTGNKFGVSFAPYDCSFVDILASIEDDIECDPFVVTYQTNSTVDITSPCNPCVGSLGSYYAIMTDDT